VVDEAKRNAAVLGFNSRGVRWYLPASDLWPRTGQPGAHRPPLFSNPAAREPTPSAPLSSATPAMAPPADDDAAAAAAGDATTTDALPPAEGAAPSSAASPDAGPPQVEPAKPRKSWWRRIIPGQ
jgi:hypothetical protein